MGFPLSTFQQLAGLCKDEPYIRKTFDNFRLVAVIVHDPSDGGFKKHIKYNFEHLHEVTGEHFAFISFINPPLRWSNAHRGWMETRERISAGANCEDAEFVNALKERLDLPDGPSIVLTDNLLSDKYVILPTSRETVLPQMENLGVWINSCAARIPLNDSGFITFLSQLGQSFEEQTEDGESLAKNIADLVAVRSLSGAGAAPDRIARQIQKEESRRYVQDVLNKLRKLVEDLRESNNEEQTLAQLEKFSDYLALILGEIGGDSHTDIEYSLNLLDYKGFEPLSNYYLSNYNRLLSFYFPSNWNDRHNLNFDFLLSDDFNLDYSPLGNYLGKAIEEEMNASVVQLIRSLLGVRMPEYYRKYEDGFDNCRVTTPQRDIILNRRGRWQGNYYADHSIQLGEIGFILNQFAQHPLFQQPMGRICEDGFIKMTRQLANLRNAACHTGLFTLNTFISMHSAFQEGMIQYLPLMLDTKNAMRNG